MNDTNILIDLANIGLLDHCRKMDISFHTTDIVIAELKNPKQKEPVERLIRDGVLHVDSFTGPEVMQFVLLYTEYSMISNLTPVDCSVMILAEKYKCRLLTSDQKLKRHARDRHIEANGLLWLTDKMVDEDVVEPIAMIEHLQKWLETNERAPHKHIMERIDKYWKGVKR